MIGRKGEHVREKQVLALYADGFGRDEIALTLGIAVSSVAEYMTRARKRYGVNRRRELIQAYRAERTSMGSSKGADA